MLTGRGRRAASVVLALAVAALVLPVGAGAAPTPAAHPACAWPMYGHDPGHSFAAAPRLLGAHPAATP